MPAILLSLLIAAATAFFALNYLGFCFSGMRFLSDDEKIKVVVEQILTMYPRRDEVVDMVSIVNGKQVRTRVKRDPENPIPYRDIDEFFKLNPNCCKVSKQVQDEGGWMAADLADRMCGRVSDFVDVTYFVRYRDAHGVEQKKAIRTMPALSNCGEPVDLF